MYGSKAITQFLVEDSLSDFSFKPSTVFNIFINELAEELKRMLIKLANGMWEKFQIINLLRNKPEDNRMKIDH